MNRNWLSKFIAKILLLFTSFCFTSCIDTSRMNLVEEKIVQEEKKLKLSQEDISLDINGTYLLNLIDADDNTNYFWSAGNSAIVCALGDGKSCNVMGVGQGESYIKVKDDVGNENYCTVVVSDYSEVGVVSASSGNLNNFVEDVKELTLSTDTVKLQPAETFQIRAAVAPSSALKTNSVNYTTTDSSVAEVFEGGTILARSVGYATIMVTCGNKTQTCDVSVEYHEENEVTDIIGITSSIYLEGRDKKEFTYSVEPIEAASTKVNITIKDPTVATIAHYSMSRRLVVSALHPGATTIELECGNIKRNYLVSVQEVAVSKIEHTIEAEKLYFLDDQKKKINLMVTITISFKISPANSSALYAYIFYNGKKDKVSDWMDATNCDIAEDGTTKSTTLTIYYYGNSWKSTKDCSDNVDFRASCPYKVPKDDGEINSQRGSIKANAEVNAPYKTTYSFFHSK